ncbi:hypothetical protein KO465_00835 [Candidatus Micrarchaeota archaeon]|nr:hypothetical protein [Candidatus Micrarchaeota archaeon]
MKTEILFALMLVFATFIILAVGIAIIFSFFYSSPEVIVDEPVIQPDVLPPISSPPSQPNQVPNFPNNGNGCSKKWGWGNC